MWMGSVCCFAEYSYVTKYGSASFERNIGARFRISIPSSFAVSAPPPRLVTV